LGSELDLGLHFFFGFSSFFGYASSYVFKISFLSSFFYDYVLFYEESFKVGHSSSITPPSFFYSGTSCFSTPIISSINYSFLIA